MTELRLGREYYHQLKDIERWCRDNVGEGDWATRLEFREDRNIQWSINVTFGYTCLRFRRDSDATLFTLKWM